MRYFDYFNPTLIVNGDSLFGFEGEEGFFRLEGEEGYFRLFNEGSHWAYGNPFVMPVPGKNLYL